jgi:putrescine transport system permease protein
VAAALELVQMSKYAKRKPHQLSGGQQQRVALARSLVKRPKLLLDEPMSALDKQIRQRTQIELVNILQKVGVTCIMVTHDQEEAMTMANRLAVMSEGQIVQIGSPSEVYEYPNSRFSAEFIGSTNLFEGITVEDEPDYVHRIARAAEPAVREPRHHRPARDAGHGVGAPRAHRADPQAARRRVQLGARPDRQRRVHGRLFAVSREARRGQDGDRERVEPRDQRARNARARRRDLRALERDRRRGADVMNALKSMFSWPVRRFNLTGATAVVAGPYTWLVLFFLVPFVLVVKISFAELQLGIPPYTELASYTDGVLHIALNLSHYAFLLTDSLYFATYVNSVVVAAITTLLCLLIGYPMAYYIARSNPATRNLLMMGVMLPFWTSFLIRVYAWIGILKNNGLLNNFLMWIGLTHTPIELYRTNYAVYIGMVYSYLPFLVMPLYAHLVKMDLRLLEAAYDLGARPWKAFVQITLPLSKNGIIAGCLLVFIPAVGEYVIPELLGGANTLMIGRVMWNEFFNNADWPMASAVTCAMVLLLLVPMAMFQHFQAKEQEGRRR